MARRSRQKTPAAVAPARKKDARSGAAPRVSSGGDVFATGAAVAVSVLVGVAWLTPVIVTAPYVVYLRRATVREGLFRRWALTVLATTALAATFVPRHTFDSVILGHSMPHLTHLWMSGSAAAPLGARFMLVTGVLYVVAALASAGVGGALVLSAVLSANAVYAVNLAANGFNLIQIGLVAISPWQWCFLAGLYVLAAPLGAMSRRRFFDRGSPAAARATPAAASMRALAVGAGLIVVAFLLRLATAGVYAALVRRWTAF